MTDDEITRRKFMRRGAVAAAGVAAGIRLAEAARFDKSKVPSYNENMEYRPLGKTGLWTSAVCLGGHWKRIDKVLGATKPKDGRSAFDQNRYDVVSRCIDAGMNYIDACSIQEVRAYSKAMKGRRDKMYMGCSWCQKEVRKKEYRTAKALLGVLDAGMKENGLEHVDLWRITMLERSGRHTEGEVEEMMKALETARKQGKVRFCGLSSHDRRHIKWMIETFPEIVQVVVTPYTADSKVLPTDSVFDAVKKHGVGVLGIKPFASNSLFKGEPARRGR